jgi:hypothetical protein
VEDAVADLVVEEVCVCDVLVADVDTQRHLGTFRLGKKMSDKSAYRQHGVAFAKPRTDMPLYQIAVEIVSRCPDRDLQFAEMMNELKKWYPNCGRPAYQAMGEAALKKAREAILE